jgi:hypothetical protein
VPLFVKKTIYSLIAQKLRQLSSLHNIPKYIAPKDLVINPLGASKNKKG